MSFLMDEGTNELLAKVRARIEEDLFEGNEEDLSEDDEDDNEYLNLDERAVGVLERIRSELESDLGEGTGQATNKSDVDAALTLYMDPILNHIVSEYGVGEEEGTNLIFKVADKLAASGDLPPMPSDESSDEDVAFWLGKAKTLGFESAVISALA